MTIGTTELAARLAESQNLTKAKAKEVIQSLASLIAEAAETDSVRIHNFGTFKTKERPARTGRNPATGDVIEIAASSALVFKATKKGA